MYRVHDYLWMLADRPRVEAYTAAIRATVRPGDVVLDLGAGIGYFGVVAALAGARRVHMADNNRAVHVARRVADANGVGDRVVVHHTDARELTLPERCDVIVGDLRGPLPFADGAVALMIDARTRLLRPGGSMIARRDELFVAPCRAPRGLREEVLPLLQGGTVDLSPVERLVFDTPVRADFQPGDLCGDGASWGTLDYRTAETADHSGQAVLAMDGAGPADGLAAWFVSDLADGISMSNRPGTGTSAYGQLFLPFGRPVTAQRLDVSIDVRLVNNTSIWAWRAAADGDLVVNRNSIAEIVVDPAAL
jgi:hypothetical protein